MSTSSVDAAKPPTTARASGTLASLPRPKPMAYIVVLGELAIGLGLVFGVLTPIAAVAGALLNVLYLVMMIHDWAEQGQNLMMILISVVVLGTHAWQRWSLGHAIGLF